MKKIENIHDLQEQKKLVEQRRVQLEKELHRDWADVKSDLSIQSNSFFGDLKSRYAGTIIRQGISFGAGLMVKKFGGKIGNKIYSWFK